MRDFRDRSSYVLKTENVYLSNRKVGQVCKMEQSIQRMLKPQLRTFLLDRGMTVSDYSVSQLRELAFKAVDLNLPIIRTPDDTASSLLQRCKTIVDGQVIKFEPFSSKKLASWSEDISAIPIFTFADIFVYLLNNCDWERGRIKGYKSERGYLLYKANHFFNVQIHDLSHDHFYVRCKCVRETSQKAEPYLTWCLMNKDGTCMSAGCECTGDDGGCKHVVGFLFSLAHWSDRHIDRHTAVCTDTKCVWDIPRKESKPKKLDAIEFSAGNSRVKPIENVFDPSSKISEHTDSDIENSLLDLVRGQDTQIIEVLDENMDVIGNPKTLKEYITQFRGNESIFTFLSSCISEKECHEIYQLTSGQSENPLWFRYREGRITSSVMPLIYKYKKNEPNNYIVKNIVNSDGNVFSTAATKYGKEREALARNLYEVDYVQAHQDSVVNVSGLIVNQSMSHLGASPDGEVRCKCCGKGVLEIKCPFKFKHLTIDKLCEENYHIYKGTDGQFKLKENSNWYLQIQFQMALANVSWCDFVVYLEGVNETGRHKVHVERIRFDLALWENMLEKANDFFKQFVLPKLLD